MDNIDGLTQLQRRLIKKGKLTLSELHKDLPEIPPIEVLPIEQIKKEEIIKQADDLVKSIIAGQVVSQDEIDKVKELMQSTLITVEEKNNSWFYYFFWWLF